MTPVIVFIVGAFVAGGVLFGYSMRNIDPADRRARWIKYLTYAGIVAMALLSWRFGPLVMAGIVAVIALRGAYEITDLRRTPGGDRVPAVVWAYYAPMAALAVFGVSANSADIALFLFVVIATFDASCQVSGQLLGKTPLAPVISPHKTVEGLIGGLIMGCCAAFFARDLSPLSTWGSVALAIPAGLVGLAGDLSMSWMKRRAGVKDFREILPGHGGVLDRFDGLLPVYAVLGLATLAKGAP